MDYSKTIIYKIVCNDLDIKEVYIGSTVNFTRRKCEHKSKCNDINNKEYNYKKYQFIRENGGWENWSMYEIEKYPCNDKNEAHTRERYWIENLNSTLNKIMPTRTIKEWKEDNKDKLFEKSKQYREDNKDKIQEQKKKHYEENKDKILERTKQYNETNKDKLLKQNKQYRETNRDKLYKQHKQYCETNKEALSEKAKVKFTCECGSFCRIRAKQRHYKSQKHIQYIESTK
jgi:hypothetical protein